MSRLPQQPHPFVDVGDWQRRGACRTLDSSMFFPADGEDGARRKWREARAKAICAGCPVRPACLEHSLRVQEPDGIWGGLTATERLQLRYQRHGQQDARIARRLIVAGGPERVSPDV
jgi:WhiB family redox-sensing transcriptional regulator